MSKRGATDLSGILCIDKPAGMTSHDVVSAVRRATGEKRVGHAGTLDPMATGVLVVLVGPATRLAPYLTAADKTYAARIVFGSRTDTDDAEGSTVSTTEVPAQFSDADWAKERVAELVGTAEQTPPAYSAVKLNGKKAYELAREGKPVEVAPRTVTIHEARFDGFHDGGNVAWNVTVRVSKGFYVRSMARDLGASLGADAHLGGLRRLASGTLSSTRARSLKAIESAEDVSDLFIPAASILEFSTLGVSPVVAEQVAVGAALPAVLTEDSEQGPFAIVSSGRLLAIYVRKDDSLVADAVFPGGVA